MSVVVMGGLICGVYSTTTENSSTHGKWYTSHILSSFNSGRVTNARNRYNVGSTTSGLIGRFDTDAGWQEIKNCFNAGAVYGGTNDGNGIVSSFTNKTDVSSVNIFNIGRVTGARRAYPITYNNNRSNASTFFYYDEQMCPNVYTGFTKDVAMTTESMLGDGMKSLLGTENWVYTPGMYPRIKGLENEAASIAAATPVYLYNVAAGDGQWDA